MAHGDPAPIVRIPPILYGTAWKKAETAPLVALAIRTGFRGLDTACQPKHYDEAGVGAGVAASLSPALARSDIFLQTKFTPLSGQDPARVPYDAGAILGDQVLQSIAVSLRNLRTDYLDCLLVHSPLPTPSLTLEAWRAIESSVDAGAVHYAGISNCYSLATLEALYRDARVKPAVVQNRFYADTGHDREIRTYCHDHGIVYQSFWTLTANADALNSAIVAALAARHERTPAQILFRYLTQAGVVPLTGTRSELHMREDLSIFEFELEDAERDAVGSLFGG